MGRGVSEDAAGRPELGTQRGVGSQSTGRESTDLGLVPTPRSLGVTLREPHPPGAPLLLLHKVGGRRAALPLPRREAESPPLGAGLHLSSDTGFPCLWVHPRGNEGLPPNPPLSCQSAPGEPGGHPTCPPALVPAAPGAGPSPSPLTRSRVPGGAQCPSPAPHPGQVPGARVTGGIQHFLTMMGPRQPGRPAAEEGVSKRPGRGPRVSARGLVMGGGDGVAVGWACFLMGSSPAALPSPAKSPPFPTGWGQGGGTGTSQAPPAPRGALHRNRMKSDSDVSPASSSR